MKTRTDLAELSKEFEDHLVLSVYLARESQDPGKGQEWLRRLETSLAELRSNIAAQAPLELPAYDKAADWILASLDSFGRVLPHEGWCAMATEDRLCFSEPLRYKPREIVRWRLGATVAPYVRALKADRPVVLAVLSAMHADLYRTDGNELAAPVELHAEWPPAEAADVGVAKRASRTTGVRGTTRGDYVKRAKDENMRRHRKNLVEELSAMAGSDGVIVLGGTQKAISAVRKDLEDAFPGRLAEDPELAFDSPPAELLAHLREAASRLTEEQQARFVDDCRDAGHGCGGWNETYRALAAGAVDTLLLARELVESSPDDAERLVRLALAQGAHVEEAGGPGSERLVRESGGVVSRLRFVPASLSA